MVLSLPSDVQGWLELIVAFAALVGIIWKIVMPLASLVTDVAEIKHELYPNSGKSLRDAVDTLKDDMAEVKTNQQNHINYHLERSRGE